jgi:cytoskeleton protein RodZ
MPPEPVPAVPAVSPSSAAAAPVNPLPVLPPEAAALSPDQSRIVIHATADAWIQVKERGGGVLLNRVLKPGESWQVPPRPGLIFTTGNAGGTELVVDGAQTGALGASGAVRRDLPLDPDLIKDGRLAPGAATPAAANRTQQ